MSKGRMLPSSLSRSQPFSRLPLAAKAFYPLLIANADDQGRLSADPQMLKWDVCPNVEELTITAIPVLLATMEDEALVKVYQDDDKAVLQLQQWWLDQSALQWAYASEYLPPDGWNDRLRFRNQGRIININWPNKADGAQSTHLSEIANQLISSTIHLSSSRSLSFAIQKALGHPASEAAPPTRKKTGTPEKSGTFAA